MAAGVLVSAARASRIARPYISVRSGGDRGQLDASVFKQFLQPLYVLGAFTGNGGSTTGQVSRLPDWF